MTKRSQRKKGFKFVVYFDVIKPVLNLLQGHIKVYEVAEFSEYKETCDCQFEVNVGGSIGFRSERGIPSEFIPILRNVITSYYRGMILQDVVHVWYNATIKKTRYNKYQPEVI